MFILHGTDDKEIPVLHAEKLFEKSNKKFKPWYVLNANHNNIEVGDEFRKPYFRNL